MKMNQSVVSSVLFNALAKAGEVAPAEGVAQGAATIVDKVKESAPVALTFAGFPYSPEGLTKLEGNFRSAYGRIKPALEARAELIAKLDKDARKKAKVKTGKNVLMEVMVRNEPRQVVSVANDLVDLGTVSRGDADTWIAYVTLASAFDIANDMNRLLA